MSISAGPLGRLNTSDKIDTPIANEEFMRFKALNGGKPVENTLYYHYARMIEVLFALERAQVLLEDPDILSTDILNTKRDLQESAGRRYRGSSRNTAAPLPD